MGFKVKHRFREKTSHAMCGGKKRFKSGRASKIAHKLNQRKYECPICGGWHLTKTEKGFDWKKRK
jgi:hypothetical protein